MELKAKVDGATEERFSDCIRVASHVAGRKVGRAEAVLEALNCWMDMVEREHGKLTVRVPSAQRKAG